LLSSGPIGFEGRRENLSQANKLSRTHATLPSGNAVSSPEPSEVS
jgi:hypothetical protein